jgi:hypothetical protein
MRNIVTGMCAEHKWLNTFEIFVIDDITFVEIVLDHTLAITFQYSVALGCGRVPVDGFTIV